MSTAAEISRFTAPGRPQSVKAEYVGGTTAVYSHVRDPTTQQWMPRFATHEYDNPEPNEVKTFNQVLDLTTVLCQSRSLGVDSRVVLTWHS